MQYGKHINCSCGMIDAEKDFDIINIEEFELLLLLKQITNGLRAQFENKNIQLILGKQQKVIISTDKI